MKDIKFLIRILLFAGLDIVAAQAQNPLISGQFTADPTARVFQGKMYVYPSHDIPTPPEKKGRKDWFCMEDYHVFSSVNLTDWTDHGVLVNQKEVPWVDGTSYSMWAPDCVEKGGKFYFFFPANVARDSTSGGGFGIGVGIGDRPEGPFIFQPNPISGVHGIDPCVLIDRDGQAYLYWAQGGLFVAKLQENLLELSSEPQALENLPQGFKEGPFVFERNGLYYLTYPYVRNKTEELVYSVGLSPMGPFRYGGVIMDESPVACWTNHQSIVRFGDQWYLFYHHNDYSPKFDKNRSIRADSLFFNEDGSIRKVIPTWRGVGVTASSSKIQMDRYTSVSPDGASISFLDSMDAFAGWKVSFTKLGTWCRYNAVRFSRVSSKKIRARIASKTGGRLEVRLSRPDGPVLVRMRVKKNTNWMIKESKTKKIDVGTHDLFVLQNGSGEVDLDWISFY
jgi:hypothetical protein